MAGMADGTRWRAAVMAAVAAFVLAGCGSGTSGQDGTDMMRERTIEAFADSDPRLSSFAEDDETRPEPIATPFVDDWYVFQLTGRHRATVVAVTKEGDPKGVQLTGHPEAWDEVVDKASVADARTAVSVADAWTKALRPTTGAARLITSVEDIELTGSTADSVREELRRDHGDAIADVSAEASDDGWTTERWMVHDNDLVRLRLTVHADATVDADRTVVREGLPGPIAL